MKSRNAISTVFLLAAILCSVSCGEDSAQTDAAKTETGAAGTTAEAVTEELLYKADNKYKGALPVHVHFVMDEFANVSLPDDFEKILFEDFNLIK